MKRLLIFLVLLCLVGISPALVRRVRLPVESRKYYLQSLDVLSPAWELDSSSDWMPVEGFFNDPHFDLDDDNGLMPATDVYFSTDGSSDLMP